MLGITLQETRVYREAREEGKDEEREKIALNLLRENVPQEIVSRTTGLIYRAITTTSILTKQGLIDGDGIRSSFAKLRIDSLENLSIIFGQINSLSLWTLPILQNLF